MAAVVVATVGVVPAAGAARPCTGSKLPGGDWPTMHGPALGRNAQTAERRITPATVGRLQTAWIAPVSGYQSIPVIAGGCVYYTDVGRVRAVDLRTGRQVWQTDALPASKYQPFAVAVANGHVHVNFDNKLAPRATVFNADTGARGWTSPPITFDYPAWQLSSATVAGRVRLFTTSGPDFDPAARPGFAVLDSRSGKVLTKRPTIPAADFAKGYSGGGIWGTPVIDHTTLYAYAGTSNPYSKRREHKYDNAMLKIDVNPRRATFGRIVASYKADPDGLGYDLPTCQVLESDDSTTPFSSLPCLQQDVDFGNSPILWTAKNGARMVSQLQKSGVMHTVRASDMKQVWKTGPLGTHPYLTLTGGNHGNAATDGTRLFFQTNPGTLIALDAATGEIAWVSATAEGIASKNVVYAGGVVFAADAVGLHAFNAATGAKLWDYTGAADGVTCASEGAGLALARGHLVANCSGSLVAFRLP